MSRPERIPALDGLRGLAVLLVLLAHAAKVGFLPFPHADLAGCGRMGVFLFFVLSAFLLTDQLLGSDELARPRTWARYFTRRLLRVYPAYVAWLFAYFALRRTVRVEPIDGWTLGDVGRHLALLEGDIHLWTIPVELRWYLALPLVVAIVAALGRRVVPAALVLLVAGAGLRWWFPPDIGFPIALGMYAPVFLAGSLAAVLHRGWRRLPEARRRSLARVADAAALAAAVGLALHVPAVAAVLRGEYVEHHAFHHEFDRMGVLWALLLLGLLWGSGVARRVFELRAARFVGLVSYSAYLGHELVLVAVENRRWSPYLVCWLFLAGSLLLGWLSHVALERPFARLWAEPGSRALAGPEDRR